MREALREAGREDLIGNGPDCLVRHAFGQGKNTHYEPDKRKKLDISKKASGSRGNRSSSKKTQNAPTNRTVFVKKANKSTNAGSSSARKIVKSNKKPAKR